MTRHPSKTDSLAPAINATIQYFQDVIQRTILSIQRYKGLEICGANDMNACVYHLEAIFRRLSSIETGDVDDHFIKIKNELQWTNNELSDIFRKHGTDNLEDLLVICFGRAFLSSVQWNVAKYAVLRQYFHPFQYKVIPWKNGRKPSLIDAAAAVTNGAANGGNGSNNAKVSSFTPASTPKIRPIASSSSSCTSTFSATAAAEGLAFGLQKTRLIDDGMIVEKSENLDCFDLSRSCRSFKTRVSGMKVAVHNDIDKKTLIISGIVDNVVLDCVSSHFVQDKLASLRSVTTDAVVNVNAELGANSTVIADPASYLRYVASLSLKELFVYENNDIRTKYQHHMMQLRVIKNKPISQIVKEFVNSELFTQRTTLIQLLLKNNDHEYEYLAYLLYDLLSGDAGSASPNNSSKLGGRNTNEYGAASSITIAYDEAGDGGGEDGGGNGDVRGAMLTTSVDSKEQSQLFDSLPWNIKTCFKDAMKQTIQYTNALCNYDMTKIPLEQQICLLKAPDTVKEKAMLKLKEIRSKSEDTGSKARQFLEGLLRIPFGTYRHEPILDVMNNVRIVFSKLLTNVHLLYPNCSLPSPANMAPTHRFTNVEIYNMIQIIESNYVNGIMPKLLSSIHARLTMPEVKREEIIETIVTLKNIIKTHEYRGSGNHYKLRHSGKNMEFMKDDMNSFFKDLIANAHTHPGVCNDIIRYFTEAQSDHAKDSLNQDLMFIKEQRNVVNSYIHGANTILDTAVHGHRKAKRHIERIIGQWINGEQCGYCFGFEGPPGVGKTSLAKKGLAHCLRDDAGNSRPFAFIAIGGSSNGSTLEGHNYTYVGSTWGRIVEILMETKCMNPIFFIDELDKVSKTEHGREIIGILTHLIDTTQNDGFQDKYFNGVELDLSKAMFVFSYNDVEAIDKVLLDRIHRIKFEHLSLEDKLVVTNHHILPDIYKKMGLENMIHLTDENIIFIIEQYTAEPGVRKLKELLFEIIGEINLDCITKSMATYPITISNDDIQHKYLKERHPAHHKKVHASPKVGIINGLWANAMGNGGIIQIEAQWIASGTMMDLKLTGMQGDVMKESMSVAKTLAWSLLPSERQHALISQFDVTKNQGIHIHCPEGATPKDGPSAGTAITCVLYSLFSGRKIRNEIAITGEIDLQGNVSMIGGLDLKILGGIRAGVKQFIYPCENKKDFDDFMTKYTGKSFLDGITFIQVHHISQALDLALTPLEP